MERVYIFNTPDVPGFKFIASRSETLCYEIQGTNLEDIKDMIDRAYADAQSLAYREGYNCIVNFNPQPVLYLAGRRFNACTFLAVSFTMGNINI